MKLPIFKRKNKKERVSLKEQVNNIIRCSECEYLHSNGNCLKVGGFYTSVRDKDCPMINEREGENDE